MKIGEKEGRYDRVTISVHEVLYNEDRMIKKGFRVWIMEKSIESLAFILS